MANIVQLFKLTNESRPTRLPAIVHQRNELIVQKWAQDRESIQD